MSLENKIALHIPYWPGSHDAGRPQLSNNELDRISYLNQMVINASNYQYKTDIFIHENQAFDSVKPWLIQYTNGKIDFIKHDMSKGDSYKWSFARASGSNIDLRMPLLSRESLCQYGSDL